MADKIKVNIRGTEYLLQGDDNESIKLAAEKVDSEIRKIEKSNLNQPLEKIAILAALNIAEEQYNNEKQFKIDENYLVTELDKMANALSDLTEKQAGN